MKAILQRVSYASVEVDNNLINEISTGFLVLLGIEVNDSVEDARMFAKKTSNLRIFNDKNGKMNLSIKDVNGEILVISNFTLCADSCNGNRPSFSNAAKSNFAEELYELYCNLLSSDVRCIKKGKFGADMKVNIINDGPVTIILDTKELK